jgi:hypothetical protein
VERDPEAPKGPTILPAVAGRAIDSALKDLDRTPAEQRQRRAQRHKGMPEVVSGWASLAAEIAPQIMERWQPPKGYHAEIVQQPQIFVNEDSQWSAMVLEAGLLYEQEKGNGTAGPFERALQLSPAFNRTGGRKTGFNKALAELPADFPLTQREIKAHLRNVWAYRFAEGGNLIACPTTQPDALIIMCKEPTQNAEDGLGPNGGQDTVDRLAVRHAATALATVLRANVGYDAKALKLGSFHFRSPDSSVEDTVDGLTAVHWALRYICEGEIILRVADVKALTHAGDTWEPLEHYWKEADSDIEKVCSIQNLTDTDPKFRKLQEHFAGYDRDLARTVYALANWLQFVEREFQSSNHGVGEPTVQWDTIVNLIHALVVAVDFNIMKSPEELEKIRSDPKRGPFKHNTVPPEDEVQRPERVGVAIREVDPEKLRKYVEERDSEIRTQRSIHERNRLTRAAMKLFA